MKAYRGTTEQIARFIAVVSALQAAEDWLAKGGCHCGTDKPGTCALCKVRAAIAAAEGEK